MPRTCASWQRRDGSAITGILILPAALWQWPEGYDPAQLLVELESRLDEWAAEVRARFLKLTGGTRLARQAVGVRVVALATAGWNAAALTTTSAVLKPPDESRLRASDAWTGADEVASRILASLRVGGVRR